MSWAESSPLGRADPYILRGLVWCGLCVRPMVAPLVVATEDEGRSYGCGRGCSRPLVPADALEALVWRSCAERFDLLSEAVAAQEQTALLLKVLERVIVGADLATVRCQWWDEP
jgi:hypothetical protein